MRGVGRRGDPAGLERSRKSAARNCSCGAAAAATLLDLNKEGPRLRGVYGRKAASVPDFAYSDALKKVDIRWDDAQPGPMAERSGCDGAGYGYGFPFGQRGREEDGDCLFEEPFEWPVALALPK